MTAAGRRFVFAPLERRGLLLGLTPIQLASLTGGILVALIAVHARPDGSGVIAGLVVALTGIAGACLPLGGRPPVAWLPVVLGWARRRSGGPVLDRSPDEGQALPVRTCPRSADRDVRRRPEPGGRSARRVDDGPPRGLGPLPDPLGSNVEVLAAPPVPGQPPLGVARDRTSGTWAAVLPVRGRAFALLDPADKERRLGAWGSVLAGMARTGSPVHRVQWVERSFAGDGDALSRYLAETVGDPSPPGVSLPTSLPTSQQSARGEYDETAVTAGPTTPEHESLVVLAIHQRRAHRALRSFGRGQDAVIGLLRREVRLLQGQLRNAELIAGDPLDGAGMVSALRTAVDPVARRRAHRGPGPSDRRGLRGAWPLATDEAWSSLRADGAWHATFWIAEWPRVEVGPDFLAPLLLAGARRTVSVTMAPVSPERARRQVEAARTADAADEELRRRAGFLSTARRRREAEGVAQRETELADGHAEFRFSGYVTVSGPDRAALEAACAEVEQVAQQSRLELRRLYGQQREAFTWTLPLARGLA
jgi:hypothetical protein